MFCKYCGNKVADHSKVCCYCGKPLAVVPTEDTQKTIAQDYEEKKASGKNRLIPVLIIMGAAIVTLLIAIVLVVMAMPSCNNLSSYLQFPNEPTVLSTEDATEPMELTEPPTEATEPEITEPEVTATEYYAPYTDSRGIYYEIVEPYPIPIANPEKDIYDSPAGNYIGDFNTIGYYTIVEQAEDPNGYTWGKLSTGEGWTMVYQQILPQLNMTFSSGAGAWRTNITINGNGFFSGSYSDSDMGDATVYVCDFDGKFNVVDIGKHGITLKLADLDNNTSQSVWYQNGVRYVGSYPYGLEECTHFILYIPGTPATQLPDEMKTWLHGAASSGTLNCYALYNPAMGYAFVS